MNDEHVKNNAHHGMSECNLMVSLGYTRLLILFLAEIAEELI